MPSVDELVEQILQHDYDPEARREYYLRTRKLKGRHKGSEELPKGRTSADAKVPAKKKPTGPTKTEQQMAELSIRLDKLKRVLQKLVDQAKSRSGSDTGPQRGKETQGDSGKSSSNHQATAKQRAASKKYYEQHKDDDKKDGTPEQEVAKLRKQIKQVRAKIERMRNELAEARNKASKRQAESKRPSPPTKK